MSVEISKIESGLSTVVNDTNSNSKEFASSSEISSSATAPSPESAFPEGGIQAWTTVLGAFLLQFATFGYVNSFGVFNDFYINKFLTGETSSSLQWIGSVQLFCVLCVAIFVGPMFDRGYFHHLVIFGSLLFVFSSFMLSLAHEHSYYQVFLSHGIGVGLGSGFIYLPSLGIGAHYFKKNQSMALGIISAGASLGAVIHPIMLNRLFQTLGFHNAVRANAGLNAGVLIIGNLLVRTRLPPNLGPTAPLKRCIKDVPFLFTLAGGMLVLVSLFFPIFFIQLNGATHNLPPNFIFYTVPIIQAANFFGRIFPHFLVPFVGLLNSTIAFTLASSALTFAMLGIKDVGGTIAFTILYGFFSGCTISLVPPVFASFSNDITEVGVRMGLGVFTGSIGGLIGLPITGALLSQSFIWWRPIVFSGIILASASTSFFVSRLGVVIKKGTQIV